MITPSIPCSWIALAMLSIQTPAADVKVAIPGQPVEISVRLPGFERAQDRPSPERALLYGELEHEATISILYEENFPFISGADSVQARSKAPGFAAFEAGGVAACEFTEALPGGFTQHTFHAFPSTPEFLFDIHVSTVTGPKDRPRSKDRFSRDELIEIVASFRCTGTVDAKTRMWPPEVYAFRDEAAQHAAEQMDWVVKQCAARADSYEAQFYLGKLAWQDAEADLVLRGFRRAAELLAQKPERTTQMTHALLDSLDSVAAVLAGQKKFRDALPVLQQIVQLTPDDPPAELQEFRVQALYNTVICYAQTKQTALALEGLRQALAARPDLKRRAADDDMLKSLRANKEFQALVKR
jgi:tetratricopeptide (TPR) repeat protein